MRLLSFVFALISILTTIGIVVVLVTGTVQFFHAVSPREFFGGSDWSPAYDPPHFGILPLVCGTFQIAVGSAAVALPLGILTGVYLSEYAHPRVRGWLKPTLELLAGIPSVVFGYVAIFLVTPLLKGIIPSIDTYNALAASIVVGIMVLPLVASLCEDAIAAVPNSLREAAYGLGSTKREVVLKVVIPAALSGISASFILALSRAIGETMAVTLAAGLNPNLTLNPLQSVQTMTAAIVNLSSGDQTPGSASDHAIFAVAGALFVITFLMNVLASRLVRRFRTVYT
jgi:phosphate transport system permease protein